MIGKRNVRHAGQAKTTAQHRAFQHRHDHLRRLLGLFEHGAKGAVQLTVGFGASGAGTGHVLDVATGAEVPTGATQDDGAHAQVVLHAVEYGAQFTDHGQAHGVAAVRAIEGDVQHAGLKVEQQGFAVR